MSRVDRVRSALGDRTAAGAARHRQLAAAAGATGPASIIAATPRPAPALGDRLVDLALELLLVLLVAGLRLRGTAELELLLGQLDVRGSVLKRRRCAPVVVGIVVVGRIRTHVGTRVRLGLERIVADVDGLQLGRAVLVFEFARAVLVLQLGRAVVEAMRRGRQALARIHRRTGLARTPVSGAFAVTGHGALRPGQRVSRCGVWHLHQRQYLRSCNRSGLFRLLLFVW